MKLAIFSSTLLCLSASIQIILILIAGLNRNFLVNWYFLKTSTSGLDVPSRLGNSEFLKDLSTLTGTDLVGSEATAQSLGLAESYTVSLFSSCAVDGDKAECSPSEFGYHFNPVEDLKLDNTGLESSFTSKFLPSISYGAASRGIAVAFIFALLLAVATIAVNLISCFTPRLIFLGAITSTFATIFELAAAAASLAVFTSLKRKFNNELSEKGIKTTLGKNLFIASWIAFGLLFINSLYLCYNYRVNKQNRRRRGIARGKGVIDHAGLDKPEGDVKGFAPPKRTRTLQLLKNHIPGLGGRHKYAEIGKEPVVKGIAVTDHDNDREVLMKKGFGGGEDEDDEREELVRGSARGIPMHSLGGNKGTEVVETGYEPFRQAP